MKEKPLGQGYWGNVPERQGQLSEVLFITFDAFWRHHGKDNRGEKQNYASEEKARLSRVDWDVCDINVLVANPFNKGPRTGSPLKLCDRLLFQNYKGMYGKTERFLIT